MELYSALSRRIYEPFARTGSVDFILSMGKKGVFKPLANPGSNLSYSSAFIPAKDESKADEEQEKSYREAQELKDEISHEHDAADDERDANQYG